MQNMQTKLKGSQGCAYYHRDGENFLVDDGRAKFAKRWYASQLLRSRGGFVRIRELSVRHQRHPLPEHRQGVSLSVGLSLSSSCPTANLINDISRALYRP